MSTRPPKLSSDDRVVVVPESSASRRNGAGRNMPPEMPPEMATEMATDAGPSPLRRLSLCLPLMALTGRSRATTLLDQNERSVTLPPTVGRIVAIPIPVASMILCLDGNASRLVGMNPAARDDVTAGLLGRMFPAVAKVPTDVAGDNFAPNVEALLATHPDLVVQWGDRGDSIVRPITAAGLPVLTLRYGDTLLAAGWLRLLGTALGHAERGAQLAASLEATAADIASRAAPLTAHARPKALYLQRLQSWTVAGRGTSMSSDIERVGGRNPAADLPGFSPVNIEQILAWDPDILLLNNFEPGLAPAALYEDSRYAGLRAVRERRVYAYPRGGFRWDPPSQESALSLTWLQAIFHPKLAAPRFRETIASTYRSLYRHELRAADIDQILRLHDNGGSAHYSALFAAGAA